MQNKIIPYWFLIFLRIYGTLHIVAAAYLLETAWEKITISVANGLFWNIIWGLLASISGIAALLTKPWGVFPVTALAVSTIFFSFALFFGPVYLGLIPFIEWFTAINYWRFWSKNKGKNDVV